MDLALLPGGVDYRDRFRPRGGPSRLTIRRLLLLVDALDRRTSRFWCAVLDRDPISQTDSLLMDLWELWVEDARHPLRQTPAERRAAEEAQRERERRKKQIKAAERRRRARVEAETIGA